MRGLKSLTILCLFSTAALLAAGNPFLGTWKLNPAKSKGTPGTLSKEETVIFEAAGDQITRMASGIDGDGKSYKMTGTLPWDGKEHKVDGPNGSPPAMVAVKQVNQRTIDVTVNVNGKVVASGRAEVSKDGKTMHSHFKGETPKGKKYDNVEVMEKQ